MKMKQNPNFEIFFSELTIFFHAKDSKDSFLPDTKLLLVEVSIVNASIYVEETQSNRGRPDLCGENATQSWTSRFLRKKRNPIVDFSIYAEETQTKKHQLMQISGSVLTATLRCT
jgi:hypothetical protein